MEMLVIHSLKVNGFALTGYMGEAVSLYIS
jgi:hypothetical protein